MSHPTPDTGEESSLPNATAVSETDELTGDDIFHLLQTERRRRVLEYLRTREPPYEMRSIAEQIAAWEHDTTVAQLSSKERQRVYISLYQTHLPKMDELGVIDYDQDRGTVEVHPTIEQLYPYLDELDRADAATDGSGDDTSDVSWRQHAGRFYGGASILSTGLITVSWAGLLTISGLVLAELVTVLFSLVTVGLSVGRA